MLVMKVQTMLNLERLLPHQRMLREKLLVPYDKLKMAGRVLFISRKYKRGYRRLEGQGRVQRPRFTRHTMRTRPQSAPKVPVPKRMCSLSLLSLVAISPTDQWTGHADADATGAQLRTLQGMILRLMRGEVAKVESNWKQQLFMKDNDIVTAKQWKAALPHMFICKNAAPAF